MTIYRWRDKPILDIEKWAYDRDELMVDIIWEVKEVNPFARKAKNIITYTEQTETMPESFFNSLRYSDARRLKKFSKRMPKVK